MTVFINRMSDMKPNFRLGLSKEKTEERKPGLLKGKLGDTFFEPLPEEELKAWEWVI